MEVDNQKTEHENEVSQELSSAGEVHLGQDSTDRKDDDEEEEEEEEEDKIVEKSHNSRFHKRNKRFPKQIEGVDNAFVAIEPKSGKEVIWNECILPEKKTDKEVAGNTCGTAPVRVNVPASSWCRSRCLDQKSEAFDVYSLGVVSLEIAVWTPLEFPQNLDLPERCQQMMSRLDNNNQKSFIEACFDTSSATKGLIKRLLNHPAVTEVPILKLLSARMIVNSILPPTNGLTSNLSTASGIAKNDPHVSVGYCSSCTSTTPSTSVSRKHSLAVKLTDLTSGSQFATEDQAPTQCEETSKGNVDTSHVGLVDCLSNQVSKTDSSRLFKVADTDRKRDDASVKASEVPGLISVPTFDDDNHSPSKTAPPLKTSQTIEIGQAELKCAYTYLSMFRRKLEMSHRIIYYCYRENGLRGCSLKKNSENHEHSCYHPPLFTTDDGGEKES
ncbi:unnamed protein product [Trichobilharzia regenti]|nr:unnamed protein product [Trichobilharzia regenti]